MTELRGFALELFKSQLENAIGQENVITSEERRKELSRDYTWLTHMWYERDQEMIIPYFVVRPGNTEEVSKVMKICNSYKVPVVPRGGGSGSAGGASTLHGGIVLDLTRMDKIIDIDEKSLVLTAEAGIFGNVLENVLNEKGLMLAHYPSSVDIATLGGYLAARGSGVMSTKYGKAEDMVLSIEVVLPDGTIINTLPVPNHACGPGLLQLFVGSEGTLGVITKVSIRIDPLPEARVFRMFKFPDIHDGIEAGRQIMASRIKPAVMRLYDPGSTDKSFNSTGVKLEGNHLVLMFDGYKEIAEIEAKKAYEICIANKGEDLGEELGKHWWDTRYVAYKPPVHPEFPLLYGTPETVTTYDKIDAIYDAKKELVETKYAKWNAKYTAHFSHWYPWGTMIYDRFYVEHPPEDPEEAFRLHNELMADCTRINLDHGAVLNEHHGIGFKLGWFMEDQYEESFKVLLNIKKSLDEKGIMNPGKLGFGIW
ncbi:FAD-binding oxidoreductase [Sporosarcina ureae]|uniref:FAD-binding oxidoreductase n=1 Tax=Sporosarcina ureae TaxID=1571 RepID=UPI0026EC8126|nr:FAD-binding oxidoreductase [Sporosarcina ureae]